MFNINDSAARLPEFLEEDNTIAQMEVGQSGWTVPWAMSVLVGMRCFLNGRYTNSSEPGGTVQMKVDRTEDGYVVYVPKGYKYQKDRTTPWVGDSNQGLIPVFKVMVGEMSYY